MRVMSMVVATAGVSIMTFTRDWTDKDAACFVR